MQNNRRVRALTLSAVLVALAMIFSYVEAIIPFNFGIPGVKLGLSNLVVILALYVLGPGYALSINLVRILMSGLLFSGMFGALYSLAGGLLSFAVMLLLKKTDRFSIIGVSIAGGVFHNVGQIIVAVIVVETLKLVVYLPVLLISGEITGFLIGLAAAKMLPLVQRAAGPGVPVI